MRRTAVVGLALAVIGLLLAVGFWPLTSVSGARLREARQGDQYAGYSVNQRILIHEKVLNVSYANIFGSAMTFLDLEDGDPNTDTVVYVSGDARALASGTVIFASAILKEVFGTFQYWEIATPQDIQPSWPIDAVFYGLMGAGVALLAWVALRKK